MRLTSKDFLEKACFWLRSLTSQVFRKLGPIKVFFWLYLASPSIVFSYPKSAQKSFRHMLIFAQSM
jgi:hypothetical protein